ncbi:hypothetical protein Tco_0116166 [Tanacetum coccineum]
MEKIRLAQVQEVGIALSKEQLAILADTGDRVDSHLDCDEVPTTQVSYMANLSSYGSDVLSEVPHSETYQNDMANQSMQAVQYFEQTPLVAYLDNEIISNSNIILYSQYLQETQQAVDKANQKAKNESLTNELERYKERVKTFEQRLNVDLRSLEKLIHSKMDDMIRDRLALK